jgi:2,3-dihydroxybiphenyl 1,2-dioxygenase
MPKSRQKRALCRLGGGLVREVVACGYLGLSSPDLEAWRSFATALGLQVSRDSTAERLFLRIDDRAFRVCVERGDIGPNNGVRYIGWEVANEHALDRLVGRLREAGVRLQEEPLLAQERRVDRLVRCEDPGGHSLEFFVGARIPQEPFVSPTGAAFVTGNRAFGDLGFSHLVVSYENFDAAWRFYIDLLGFDLSDVCILGGQRWFFTHVNPRHHSFALARGPGPSAFHHFMLEVKSLDMVGCCHDRLTALGAAFTTTIGKHNNDHMVSFYVRTPSGIEVEYGCGGVLIDDPAWIVTTYDGASVWGHRLLKS